MLLMLTWMSQEGQGPQTREHDEARQYQRRHKDKQYTKFAQGADRCRLPHNITPTMLQGEAAGMRWHTGSTFVHDIDRVNQELYEAGRHAHQEGGGSAAQRGGDR